MTTHPDRPDPAAPSGASGAVYDEAYYEQNYSRDKNGAAIGPPYRRGEPHWEQFFDLVADRLVSELHPATVMDAGCAIGLLVEKLRERGVDARGIDLSEWAIGQVPGALRPYCTLGSLTEDLLGSYDLITCIEVLEHMEPDDAAVACANLCRHADTIVFSSTPDCFDEPTHLNVQPSDYWVGLFARHGFFRDFQQEPTYVAPHAIVFRRRNLRAPEVAAEYERAWDQAHRSLGAVRNARDRHEAEAVVLRAEVEDLRGHLIAANEYVVGLNVERDRAVSELALVRADIEARQAEAPATTPPAPPPSRIPGFVPDPAAKALRRARALTLRATRASAVRRAQRSTPPRTPVTSVAARPAVPDDLVPAPGSYEDWVACFDTLDDDARAILAARLGGLSTGPLVSIVMPVYNPAEHHLRAAIESVLAQVYAHWELCIADDASSAPWVDDTLRHYEQKDQRIRVVRRSENGHISAATNSALAIARGEWVGFVDHDDQLAEHALAAVVLAVAARPGAGLLYSDEDKFDETGQRSQPYFKPDWDPLLLLCQNYLAHFCVIRRDLVEATGGCRVGFEGSQDWDLALRVTERLEPDQVVHIPRVLYHWRIHEGSTSHLQAAKPYAAHAATRATTEHLARCDQRGTVEPLGRIGYQRVRWELADPVPRVSVIVPTRDGPYLARCLDSLLFRTSYPDYEVIVVDNGSRDPGVLGYLGGRTHQFRILRDPRPFNFSALNNAAVEQARGEVLCLLNDDTEVITNGWLEELVSQLLQPGVGIAGAKLYYSDGRIQHAGVILGIGGVAGHTFRGADRLEFGHFGHAVLPRSPSAVTAACMVVRRGLWDELGGLDEALAVTYNDVDFCLRARRAGWRTVWTPTAELFHYESVSRGGDTEQTTRARARVEYQLMLDRWGDLLTQDPQYNPNLSLDSADFALAWPPRLARRPAGTP